MKKNAQITLRITAKPHAHLQTLSKTHANFQKDPTKIVELPSNEWTYFVTDSKMDRLMDARDIGGDKFNNMGCLKTAASGLVLSQIWGTGSGHCCKSSKHLRKLRVGTLNVNTLRGALLCGGNTTS